MADGVDPVVSQQESAQSYADLCSRILQKPCFSGRGGGAWQVTMGAAMDQQVDRLYYAVQCRFPAFAPSDALFYLANERGIERVVLIGTGGTLESEDVHRGHLQQAWNIWNRAGSQQEQIDVLGWCGLGAVQVLRRQEFSTPPLVGSPYVVAFAHQVWSQFDILVRKPMPITGLTWGSGWHYGDGSTWGTSLKTTEVAMLKRLIRNFKSAHDTCTYMYLDLNGGPLWGTFVWNDGTTYGGTGSVTAIVVGEAEWSLRGLD